jgi:DHA1 family bicyclomycin/chloramphenicol resistance-like MFS transporter
VNLSVLLSSARRLLTDRGFLALTFLGGFGMASFFVFIASASFVYSEAFGLSPTGFSLAFAVNAIGFFASSQMAAGLGMRFGARRVVAVATTGFMVSALVLFGLGLAGLAGLYVTVGRAVHCQRLP